MNHRHLVEIAALMAAHSPQIISGQSPLPSRSLARYWQLSQRRLRDWLSLLARHQRDSQFADRDELSQMWARLRPMLEEIFVAEMLHRIWGAILVAHDQEHGSRATESVARNILIGVLDARKRTLELMVDPRLTMEELQPLDAVRRRVERWTDLLIGQLVEQYQVADFAFDAERAREFGAQQLLQSRERSRDQVWVLMLIGLRGAFSDADLEDSVGAHYEDVITTILNSCPPQAFQPVGPFKIIVQQRIQRQQQTEATLAAERSHSGQRVRYFTDIDAESPPVPRISFRDLRRRMPPC